MASLFGAASRLAAGARVLRHGMAVGRRFVGAGLQVLGFWLHFFLVFL